MTDFIVSNSLLRPRTLEAMDWITLQIPNERIETATSSP